MITKRRGGKQLSNRFAVGRVVGLDFVFIHHTFESFALVGSLHNPLVVMEGLMGQSIPPAPVALKASVRAAGRRGKNIDAVSKRVRRGTAKHANFLGGVTADALGRGLRALLSYRQVFIM